MLELKDIRKSYVIGETKQLVLKGIDLKFRKSEFTSILWAQGITPEAEGTYRCVITDATGITKTSAEATVSIKAAEG